MSAYSHRPDDEPEGKGIVLFLVIMGILFCICIGKIIQIVITGGAG